MKKVLFVLPSLTVGGMEKMAVTLSNKLTEAGYRVTLLLLDNITDLKDELSEGVRLICKPYKPHLGNKLPYLRSKFYDDGMWKREPSPHSFTNITSEMNALTWKSRFSGDCR